MKKRIISIIIMTTIVMSMCANVCYATAGHSNSYYKNKIIAIENVSFNTNNTSVIRSSITSFNNLVKEVNSDKYVSGKTTLVSRINSDINYLNGQIQYLTMSYYDKQIRNAKLSINPFGVSDDIIQKAINSLNAVKTVIDQNKVLTKANKDSLESEIDAYISYYTKEMSGNHTGNMTVILSDGTNFVFSINGVKYTMPSNLAKLYFNGHKFEFITGGTSGTVSSGLMYFDGTTRIYYNEDGSILSRE